MKTPANIHPHQDPVAPEQDREGAAGTKMARPHDTGHGKLHDIGEGGTVSWDAGLPPNRIGLKDAKPQALRKTSRQ